MIPSLPPAERKKRAVDPASLPAHHVDGLPDDLLERIQTLRDPMMFLRWCAHTSDPADQARPIKPFPWHKPYIEPMVRLWQLSPLFCVDKSRRMVVSWTMMLLHLHYTFTNVQRFVGIFSKKQEDAAELIHRAHWSYERIPEQVWPAHLRPIAEPFENHMDFPEVGSRMQAFPQGADQARQHGFSRIMFDEFGFWPEAEETWGATYPTIQGGGMITIVSTHPKLYAGAEPFYKKILQDRL